MNRGEGACGGVVINDVEWLNEVELRSVIKVLGANAKWKVWSEWLI